MDPSTVNRIYEQVRTLLYELLFGDIPPACTTAVYLCPQDGCDRVAPDMWLVYRHHIAAHSPEPPYYLCDKEYCEFFMLRTHSELVQLGRRHQGRDHVHALWRVLNGDESVATLEEAAATYNYLVTNPRRKTYLYVHSRYCPTYSEVCRAHPRGASGLFVLPRTMFPKDLGGSGVYKKSNPLFAPHCAIEVRAWLECNNHGDVIVYPPQRAYPPKRRVPPKPKRVYKRASEGDKKKEPKKRILRLNGWDNRATKRRKLRHRARTAASTPALLDPILPEADGQVSSSEEDMDSYVPATALDPLFCLLDADVRTVTK